MIPGRGVPSVWLDPGDGLMPQLHLPMFPAGVTAITDELAFERRDGKIAYFNGHMSVFVHAEDDVATFRMITSQFCANGHARQCDIIRAFGVTSISVKRAVKLYRERGAKGFYAPRATRGSAVLSAGVVAECLSENKLSLLNRLATALLNSLNLLTIFSPFSEFGGNAGCGPVRTDAAMTAA